MHRSFKFECMYLPYNCYKEITSFIEQLGKLLAACPRNVARFSKSRCFCFGNNMGSIQAHYSSLSYIFAQLKYRISLYLRQSLHCVCHWSQRLPIGCRERQFYAYTPRKPYLHRCTPKLAREIMLRANVISPCLFAFFFLTLLLLLLFFCTKPK